MGERCDGLGNLAAVELPDGSTWEFGYDGLSRLTGMRDGGGGEWAMGYGPDGMLAATTDPTGVERRVARGPFGAPVAVTDGGDDAAAVYDRLGRLMSVTGPDGGTRVNRYDLCGRLVETMDAAGATTRFGRDAAGRVVEVTQPTGRSYRYEWDECGRWAATVSTGGDRREIVHDADSRIVGRPGRPGRCRGRFRSDEGRPWLPDQARVGHSLDWADVTDDDVQLRLAGPQDAPAVLAIIHEAFGARRALDPPPEALSDTVDDVRARIADGGGIIATVGCRDAACLLMSAPDPDTLMVHRVSVRPRLQHCGLDAQI